MSLVQTQLAIRVYYEDTDFSGNVYHAAYVKFMERGRTEFLREVGMHHSTLQTEGLVFVVRKLNVTYLKPAHIDDLLVVKTSLSRLSGARMNLIQQVFLDEHMLIDGQVEVAIVGENGRPKRLPPALGKQLSKA